MDSLGWVLCISKKWLGGGHFPVKIPPKWKNSKIKIASAHIYIPRNNPAKLQNYLKDSLGGVADKGPLYICISKKWFWGAFSPKIHPKMKKSQIKIASAHIPIPRNNPAKFHNNPMDCLGEVADNRFRTDGWTYIRKDKGNLVFPTSLKAGHKKQTNPPLMAWTLLQ